MGLYSHGSVVRSTLRRGALRDDSTYMTPQCRSRYGGGKLCRRLPIMKCENGHAICRAHFIRIGLADPAPFACAVCGAYCRLSDEIVAAFREADAQTTEAIDVRA